MKKAPRVKKTRRTLFSNDDVTQREKEEEEEEVEDDDDTEDILLRPQPTVARVGTVILELDEEEEELIAKDTKKNRKEALGIPGREDGENDGMEEEGEGAFVEWTRDMIMEHRSSGGSGDVDWNVGLQATRGLSLMMQRSKATSQGI